MPEGPSIVILKESIQRFKGKKIIAATGNAKFDKSFLVNTVVRDFQSWGKHFLIITKKGSLRVHFLLFGSYSIDEQTKPDKSLRLCLQFSKGALYLYTCSIRLLEQEPDEIYDWSADVMNDNWNASAARRKLKAMPETMVCDALLDQTVFAGVGNIIKNEVLYRIKLHPECKLKDVPAVKLNALIKEARNYSFDFLEWKKAFVLKKHWLAHTKKTCKRCDLPLTKRYSGKTQRRTFFCESCQVFYGKRMPDTTGMVNKTAQQKPVKPIKKKKASRK